MPAWASKVALLRKQYWKLQQAREEEDHCSENKVQPCNTNITESLLLCNVRMSLKVVVFFVFLFLFCFVLFFCFLFVCFFVVCFFTFCIMPQFL